MSRFTGDQSITALTSDQDRIRRLEETVKLLEWKQANSFVLGRMRFDRSVPTNSADVLPPDKLYDIVRDTSFEYVLINDAGSLAWRRISYSAF